MRRIFCNYFGCRNIKTGSKFSRIADSKASEKDNENQCIAESDDTKLAPLGCFVSEPVSQYRLMDEQRTFNLGIGDHIIGTSSTNPIIIIDHDVEPSRQERMQCSFEKNVKDCNMIHQVEQSDKIGRFVEARSFGQSDQIGFDGNQMLTRLSQADSSKGKQVHTNDDAGLRARILLKSASRTILKTEIPSKLQW